MATLYFTNAESQYFTFTESRGHLVFEQAIDYRWQVVPAFESSSDLFPIPVTTLPVELQLDLSLLAGLMAYLAGQLTSEWLQLLNLITTAYELAQRWVWRDCLMRTEDIIYECVQAEHRQEARLAMAA